MQGARSLTRSIGIAAALAAAAAVTFAASDAEAAVVDRSFGEAGFAIAGDPVSGERTRAATLDAKSRIVTVASSHGQLQLTRLLPDGDPDPSFGVQGIAEVGFGTQDARADDIVSDGSAILTAGFSGFEGGDQDSYYRFQVTRLSPDGQLDAGFGDGGVAIASRLSYGIAYAIARDSRGRIWAAGRTSRNYGGPPDLAIARFTPQGQLDRGFADDGIWRKDLERGANRSPEEIDDIAIDERGRLLFAATRGPSSESSGHMLVGRLLPGGELDRSFGDRGLRRVFVLDRHRYSRAAAIAIDRRGRAVVTGSAQNYRGQNEFAVARLDPDGSLDHSFSGDGLRQLGQYKADATDIDVLGGNRLLVSGRSDGYGHTPQMTAVALTHKGALDRSFGRGGRFVARFGFSSRSVDALAGQPGRLLLAGDTEQRTPAGDSSQLDVGVIALKRR